jgi:hypothetical protein
MHSILIAKSGLSFIVEVTFLAHKNSRPDKDLVPIALPSSHAIANSYVRGWLLLFCIFVVLF